GTLIAILVLPLYVPILIFGSASVSNASAGLPIAAELYFLSGLSMLAITLSPFACASAIRARLSV
ncbi:MAG: heme exporter protein CcmB, partial [Pseudomonadota bacterium]